MEELLKRITALENQVKELTKGNVLVMSDLPIAVKDGILIYESTYNGAKGYILQLSERQLIERQIKLSANHNGLRLFSQTGKLFILPEQAPLFIDMNKAELYPEDYK